MSRRNRPVTMKYPVFRYLLLASALVLAGSAVASAESRGIEARTRYRIQNELSAWERLRPWDAGWRHTTLWQDGWTFRTEFAPRGCYVTRYVTTRSGTRLQELFIC
jgi:hypothetical protein